MVSPIKTDVKELILRSNNEDNFVEVSSHHNLSHVRQLILEEFDKDQLPSGEEGFAFRVSGIRISEKQEAKKGAFDLIERGVLVELVGRGVKRAADREMEGDSKRMKMEECGFVTPHESRRNNDVNDVECDEKEDANTVAGEHNNNTIMAPVDLDSKFDEKKVPEEEEDYFSSSESTVELDRTTLDAKEAAVNKSVVECGGTGKEMNKTVDTEDKDGRAGGTDGAGELVENATAQMNESTEKDDAADDVEGKSTNESLMKGHDDQDSMDLDLIEAGDNISNYGESGIAEAEADMSEDKDEEVEVVIEHDPHKEADKAKEKSKHVLSELTKILKDNPDFCSELRRNELLEDIDDIAKKGTPRTVIGVLGNTGVGKSSLLNSLLEEASVLPTSGSRGCTAAVVELVFNSDLIRQPHQPDEMVPVYKGEVEFITLDDWRKELKVLVDECSTQEKTIYAVPPKEDNMPDAYAAWQKIEQVYGKKSMERFHGMQSAHVFNVLANDLRVKKLLTSTEHGRENNSIKVHVGETSPGSEEVKELLKPYILMKGKAKSAKKEWAKEFRSKINNYVYRLGNGDQPQTWPLINKVELRGPWHVLSTGACLVDLPGVRDSNAARAKVAERYLQNCNQIAIVASIKRAVDDGTAKELMGDQFKRRLLMDGNYGNVFFVCTQTDDLEATETMRDHQDVAEQVPGRWEKMCELAEKISDLEQHINKMLQGKEDLEYRIEDTKQEWKESVADMKEAKEEYDSAEVISGLETVAADNKVAWESAKAALKAWETANLSIIERDQAKCDCLQKKLKAICSSIRNEYSTACLQDDFKSGLKELYRKDDDDGEASNTETALPEEFNMDVFCISSNDYLKLMKIKPRRDGPPSTFSNASDTQIPQLRAYVHSTTARFSQSAVKSFVENASDVLDRMKLIASDINEVPAGRSGFRMKSVFNTAMENLEASIQPIAQTFKREIDQKIERSLATSLKTGALKGSQEAMSTVHSWGSKSRRTRYERRPDKNGLYWSTYNAVARREGVYTSPTVGAIDFNQELVDPMEKEFSTEWQAVLDSLIRRLLNDAENKVLQLCTAACQSLANSLRQIGVDASRLATMLNTANRSSLSAAKGAFQQMHATAIDSQRELSRELLPSVRDKMRSTYDACVGVERGSGRFDRMKHAMSTSSQRAVNSMFDAASSAILSGIKSLIVKLANMIESTSEIIKKSNETVYGYLWDDSNSQKSAEILDPVALKKTRDCRNALLPELNKLVVSQQQACKLVGIEREDIELDVLGVESFEQTIARKMEQARKEGAVFDFCDSDDEDNNPVQPNNMVRVKTERKKGTYSRVVSGHSDVIDLCDSDDEGDKKLPASEATKTASTVIVKKEAMVEEAWL